MSTVRSHLQKAHSAQAEFHRAMADCHRSALTDADNSHREFHKTAARHHEDAAEAHESMCEECAKATDAADLSKHSDDALDARIRKAVGDVMATTLVPTRVGGVGVPAPVRPGITPVFRTGHTPAVPGNGDAAAKVPLEFQKIFVTEDPE